MTDLTYDTAEIPVREAILGAHRNAWRRIARPGNWFDGLTRVAIAAESRNAPGCVLCGERKAAMSPLPRVFTGARGPDRHWSACGALLWLVKTSSAAVTLANGPSAG